MADRMKSKAASRVLLVDDAHQGPTARILAAACADDNSSGRRSFDIITVEEAGGHAKALDTQETVVFVSLSETALSLPSQSPNSHRTACKELELAQSLIQSDARLRVILVLQAGISVFTGLDTAAALLAGMAGLVDDRRLIAEGYLDLILSHDHLRRNGRTMLIPDDLANRLQSIKALLEDWQLEDESDPSSDLKCFRTAIALAQIDRLRPLRGPGKTYSFVKLARSLNLAEPVTAFHLSEGDLRKTLASLADRFIGDDHEDIDRIMLPEYAREREFPSNPPVIRGITERETPKRLYTACLSAQIRPLATLSGINLSAAHLPNQEFRHLAQRRTKERKNGQAYKPRLPGLDRG